MKKYYEILGLEEGASREEIQIKYKQLCEKFDPNNNDNQDFFKEEFKKIQEAYKELTKDSILANSKGAKITSSSQGAKKIKEDSNDKQTNKSGNVNSKKQKGEPSKLFSKQNIIILLILGLIGHNFYLQVKITETTDYASDAADYAQDAAENAKDAADYASDAAENANSAKYYASDAADYASNAADYAEDARDYSFGYTCSYCP